MTSLQRGFTKRLRCNSVMWGTGVVLLFASAISEAQVYKWVDARGRTHYSENKNDAGNAKVEELRFKPTSSTEGTGPTAEYWQAQEQEFRARHAERMGGGEAGSGSTPAPKPEPLSKDK